MNRRKFIKASGVFVPAAFGILIPRAQGQQAYLPNRREAFRPKSAGASCPDDGSPSQGPSATTETYRFGSTTDNIFHGQNEWNDGGVSRTICKVAFEVTAIDGTVSGKTYKAYIYTLTGTSLNAIQATSNALTGIATIGWKVLTFPIPFATGGASTPYGLAVKAEDGADGSNLLWVSNSTTAEISGHRELWNSSGAAQLGSGNDCGLRIYYT